MPTTVTRSTSSLRRRVGAATRIFTAAAIAAATALSAVGPAQAAECKDPEALTFAIVPTEESVAELELYKPVTDRLAKLTGKKIQFLRLCKRLHKRN